MDNSTKITRVIEFCEAAKKYVEVNNIEATFEFTRAQLDEIRVKWRVAIPGQIFEFVINDTKPNKYSLKKLAETIGYDGFPSSVQELEDAFEEPLLEAEEEVPVFEQIVTPELEMYIPKKDKFFIGKNDNYEIIKSIISAGEFFPVYIYGISGIGKTTSIEQACSALKRLFFRAQITRDTIDEDLIGGMKLVDGNTVWQDGPVLMAYRTGGVLLLDEVDLNNNLMILQGILEGKPFYVKQTSELVTPAQGFTVFATGNSKGMGESEYIGTTVLNEAQRDRYALYLQQEIPPIKQEVAIAKRVMKYENIKMTKYLFDTLFRWLDMVRTSYGKETIDTYVSTRRVYFILKAYKMLGNMSKALERTLSCYTQDSSEALMKIWHSVYEQAKEDAEKIKERTKSSSSKTAAAVAANETEVDIMSEDNINDVESLRKLVLSLAKTDQEQAVEVWNTHISKFVKKN